jgi:hypothetical protein
MSIANSIDRKDIIKNIELRLGGRLIDVELTSDQLNLCIDFALRKFRQLSYGAVEESYIILKLAQDQKEYILPNEVLQFQLVYRKGFGRGIESAGNL